MVAHLVEEVEALVTKAICDGDFMPAFLVQLEKVDVVEEGSELSFSQLVISPPYNYERADIRNVSHGMSYPGARWLA